MSIYLRSGTKVKITEAIEALSPGEGHYLLKVQNIDTGKLYDDWRAIYELRASNGLNEIESVIKEILIKNDPLSKSLKDRFIQNYPQSLKELGYY